MCWDLGLRRTRVINTDSFRRGKKSWISKPPTQMGKKISTDGASLTFQGHLQLEIGQERGENHPPRCGLPEEGSDKGRLPHPVIPGKLVELTGLLRQVMLLHLFGPPLSSSMTHQCVRPEGRSLSHTVLHHHTAAQHLKIDWKYREAKKG